MNYKITDGSAEVTVTDKGAMLTSLIKDGTEYLWQGDAKYWAGQAPVCFPIVGVLPDGKGVAFGKECNMKRHGVARINPFDVMKKSENSITFVQHSSEDTKKEYPFDYQLMIEYTVLDNSIITRYTVKNTGSDKMPFVIGGHPAFNCPLTNDEDFTDYKVVFEKELNVIPLRPDHKTGIVDVSKRYDVVKDGKEIPLTHDLFYEDALVFDNINAKSATLMGKSGKGVKVDFADMNNFLVWSAENDAPFVALEPWSGISNCTDENNMIENKRGMTILLPQESKTLGFSITLI